VKRLAENLKGLLRWIVRWLPEALLLILLVGLAPAVLFFAQAVAETAGKVWSDSGALFGSRAGKVNALAWTVCVLGGLGLTWLILSRLQCIWAVARKMIVEAMHRKVALVILVFFVVLMPSLPFILKTEGNPKSQVQIVVTYALALSQVLLSLLAVLLCTASVCGEIDNKQIQVLDSKPMPRWHYLVGKLLGVMVLCSALLFLMAGSVYGLVLVLSRDRDFSHLAPWEARQAQLDLAKVRQEVLVTRRSVYPVIPDYSAAVEEDVRKGREEGTITTPLQMLRRRLELHKQLRNQFMSAGPMRAPSVWRFEGLKPDPSLPLTLRFKPRRFNYQAPGSFPGQWFLCREVEGGQEAGQEGPSITGEPLSGVRTYVVDRAQEIALPGALVNEGGVAYVGFANAATEYVYYFDPDGGLELLQRTEGFLPNYYRSLLVILSHILLLACISTMAAAALSFPVASLTVGGIFIAGMISPWVASISSEPGIFPALIRALCYVLPQFARFGPIGDLVNGRAVGWGYVGQAIAVLGFGWGGISMLLAAYIYHKRELARVIL